MSHLKYPMRRTDPLHPPPEYATLRRSSGPVRAELRDRPGEWVWLVARDADVRAVLTDTRFSSDSRRSGYPSRRTHSALIRMDPPEHTMYRRMLKHEFATERIGKLRPLVERYTGALLDTFMAGPMPGDLVRSVARPLPAMVICHLLGVSLDHHEYLQERTTEALRLDASEAEVDAAVSDLGDFMRDVVEDKRRTRSDDLLGRLIRNYVETGACDIETAADLARLLLVAGHVTTVNMIGLGILVLLEYPEQRDAVRDNDAAVQPAVEELLRHLSITATLSRVATQDISVGDAVIRAGDGVLVLLSSANRDDAAYEEPDQVDVKRARNAHVAFGWGQHLCLGASLARLELAVVLPEVLRRMPNLTVAAPVKDLAFREKVLIYGVQDLPVSW